MTAATAPSHGGIPVADENAISHVANARQILGQILESIPAKYLTPDSRVNSLVSCADLVALRGRLLFAQAALEREHAQADGAR